MRFAATPNPYLQFSSPYINTCTQPIKHHKTIQSSKHSIKPYKELLPFESLYILVLKADVGNEVVLVYIYIFSYIYTHNLHTYMYTQTQGTLKWQGFRLQTYRLMLAP